MEKNEMAIAQVLAPEVVAMQEKFEVACRSAQNLQLQDNACAAFQAVCVVSQLRAALTPQVMEQVFMPLMNTTIGFRTDKDPNKKDKNGNAIKPYDQNVVRDCLIDAVSNGLMPTGNQFNIIAARMYPTKEGYSALLKKIGCKYFISIGQDSQPSNAPFGELKCTINYEHQGVKNGFSIIANVKKDNFSSYDQLKGKAERRAKKALYEFLTGCDLGDADEDSATPIDQKRAERAENANKGAEVAFEEVPQSNGEDWRAKQAAAKSNQQGPDF